MKKILLALSVMLAMSVPDARAATRRALLIGINDYTASRLSARIAPIDRDLDDLTGTVNDVGILRQLLTLRYGFQERDIVTLTNHHATREAILDALDRHLVEPAAKGDVVFFYFAGHGSQVRNTLSDEPDRMDESLVPADARLGARDIRDKELRPRFNAILERGARLTIVFDKCHGASGARGLPTGARPRGVEPDLRDAADRTPYGPRPENRGALVLAASQDYDPAWETPDERGNYHGVFSWALIRSLCESSEEESASETFLRARARMRAERPYQDPVMAGSENGRSEPFLHAGGARRRQRAIVAIEKIGDDGTVYLQGGWANGLAVGAELRVAGKSADTATLKITEMVGVGRSQARLVSGRSVPPAIKPGALLEVVGWAPPPGSPFRVWMPSVPAGADAIAALARKLAGQASRRGLRWIDDPLAGTPTHVLRRGIAEWELLPSSGGVQRVGARFEDAVAVVARLPRGSSLFVQFPAPAAVVAAIAIAPSDGVHPTARAEEADYFLLGRFSGDRLTYAWMRPGVLAADRQKSGLPLRTDWMGAAGGAERLRRDALRLRRIHAWHVLQSPPGERSSYRLALRRTRDGAIAKDVLLGGEQYEIALRSPVPGARQRFAYVFVIDSHGNGVLLYPRSGSVENRVPLSLPAPQEIRLGESSSFTVSEPYGIDTYFLLTTDESLPNPWILEWDGVRTRAPASPTALEQFLMLIGSGERAGLEIVPTTWSLERFTYQSVAHRKQALR